ncbi:MAG: Dabb family protein [Marinilabiliales bacterium]|nr:Dabb family protein [Marinilabiliales bacterium]
MFNHIVLFKLKEFSNPADKSAIRKQIIEELNELKNKIEGLKVLETGENVESDGASFDISLITRFDRLEDYLIYKDHPEHLKVVSLVRANTIDRAVVDYNG